MKISLNWIFDHIKSDVPQIDIVQLVERFIQTTAEIEGWQKVTTSPENLTLVCITSVGAENVVVQSPELKKEYIVAPRAGIVVGSWYLMAGGGEQWEWATAIHVGGKKDLLLPALNVAADLRAGGWKNMLECEDHIIEVDNKSINHRPDLWGHRGIAREIAAIFDLPLRPLSDFVVQKNSVEYESSAQATAQEPFSVMIRSMEACKRFSALYIKDLQSSPSQLTMIIRLSRLDSRSIDLLVDTTNYVMLDLGQPMHAFDADLLIEKNLIVRYAHAQEKLSLLDGETITLTPQDLIIADGERVISLAGVMGGSTTAITSKTKSVMLESANFEATIVRRTAARHKKRTEASMRFEKSLDPNNITDALVRFLFLLDKAGVSYKANDSIVTVGTSNEQRIIVVAHSFIQARIGMVIPSDQIKIILEKLFFSVSQVTENGDITYTITVPSFRATKDMKIAEDVVEEIGRSVGYDVIPPVMPIVSLVPSDLHKIYCVRAIKRFLSYGITMRELYCYSFFDEPFLRELAWEPNDFVALKNPISEHYTRLVTTLQPHLLKAVGDNSIHHKTLRFFEWGRVWHMQSNAIVEQKSVSGVFFEQDKSIDFYAAKMLLNRLFDQLHITVSWQRTDEASIVFPWFMRHQTAVLMHNDIVIGNAGMIDDAVVQALSPAGGTAFMFELDGDYLINYKRPLTRFAPLPKYPSVLRDVSMLLPLSITIDQVTAAIKTVDVRIVDVTLIDFFTRLEWKDQKAVTFHVEIRDNEKTLDHEDVEKIWNMVLMQLQKRGAVIR